MTQGDFDIETKELLEVESKYRSRLFQRARWKMLDYHERENRIVNIDDHGAMLPSPPAPDPPIRDIWKIVITLLNSSSFSETQRAVLLLHHYEGYSYREIAAIMADGHLATDAMRREAVNLKKICQRTRDKLQKLLRERYNLERLF